jgi:hypothetical protein
VLADLGYEGERTALTTTVKTTAGRRLTDDERTVNLLHAAVRAPTERGNSLLKTTFKITVEGLGLRGRTERLRKVITDRARHASTSWAVGPWLWLLQASMKAKARCWSSVRMSTAESLPAVRLRSDLAG